MLAVNTLLSFRYLATKNQKRVKLTSRKIARRRMFHTLIVFIQKSRCLRILVIMIPLIRDEFIKKYKTEKEMCAQIFPHVSAKKRFLIPCPIADDDRPPWIDRSRGAAGRRRRRQRRDPRRIFSSPEVRGRYGFRKKILDTLPARALARLAGGSSASRGGRRAPEGEAPV